MCEAFLLGGSDGSDSDKISRKKNIPNVLWFVLLACAQSDLMQKEERSSSRGHFSIVTQLENDEANLFHAGRDSPL